MLRTEQEKPGNQGRTARLVSQSETGQLFMDGEGESALLVL